jgi:GNAT superfamily N-acetyltransferase
MIKTVPVAYILESTDLIAEYAEECSIRDIGIANPQSATYAVMESSGMMTCFMAFDGPVKLGFAIMLAVVFPHYGKKVATVESIFVGKEFRGTGAGKELMQAIESHAKQIGCVGILYSAPVGGKFERLLASTEGYKRTNSVFLRSIA